MKDGLANWGAGSIYNKQELLNTLRECVRDMNRYSDGGSAFVFKYELSTERRISAFDRNKMRQAHGEITCVRDGFERPYEAVVRQYDNGLFVTISHWLSDPWTLRNDVQTMLWISQLGDAHTRPRLSLNGGEVAFQGVSASAPLCWSTPPYLARLIGELDDVVTKVERRFAMVV